MRLVDFDKWYNTKYIVIEMLKFHKDREMMFTKRFSPLEPIVTFKHTMCNSFDRFQKIKGNSTILDVYHHLETLKTEDMPWELKQDNKWGNDIKAEIFNYTHYENTRQYAFDIDAEDDILQAYREAMIVKRYMESKYHCKAFVVFSGSKGFHVDCDLYGPANDVRIENLEIYEKLRVSCPHLDNIYGRRRAWRTPYSLHSKTGLVCFPLGYIEHELLKNCYLEQFLLSMHPKRVMRDVHIVGRGYGIKD